ncbi:MAG TPA: helix-turn-helix transcriptional regulator [Actinomycetota bacterium]|nr:helix-turn-helix transcriptional regulator [Actinomycetota bacterium]
MPASRGPDPARSVTACLGTLLRHLRVLQGLTQTELGRGTGFDGSYIGATERAAVRPSRVLIERCDHTLQAGGALLTLWPLADREWVTRTAPTPPGPGERPGSDAMPRCPVAPGLAAGAPPGLGGHLRADPVLEAMELARQAEASEVGEETMAVLERAVARLERAALATPPEELIPSVRARRCHAGRLLERPLTLGRHRRLLVAAGWLSLLLARLHFDAGDREAAEADRDSAFRLAGQADHAELAALAVELLTSWAFADGRFDDALTLARTGQDLAPPASAAALQLALDEAEALASLGRREEAAAAHHLAALTRAMLPDAAAS